MLRRLAARCARRVMGTITHVTTNEPWIALTFDDGPDPQTTLPLLELLERYDAKATFFMLGERARRFPELVKAIARHGHAIGNHSYNHPSFPYLSARERRRQIVDCAKALAPYEAPLFRPPYGNQSWASRLDALLLGYRVVTWNIVACDWLDHDCQKMEQEVARHLCPGSIILFHDGLYHAVAADYEDRSAMLQTVACLLERYHDQYRFVTVPALLESGQPQRKIWLQKADAGFLNGLKLNSRVAAETGRDRVRRYPSGSP